MYSGTIANPIEHLLHESYLPCVTQMEQLFASNSVPRFTLEKRRYALSPFLSRKSQNKLQGISLLHTYPSFKTLVCSKILFAAFPV